MFKIIKIENPKEAQDFFGKHDENARLIEQECHVKISSKSDGLKVSASNRGKLEKAVYCIENFLHLIRTHRNPDRKELELMLVSARGNQREKKSGESKLSLEPYFETADISKKEKVAVQTT